MRLQDPLAALKGMGPKTTAVFAKHGIVTLEDLLYFFPRGWVDARTITPLRDFRPGQGALISGQIVTVREGMSQRTRIPYLRALIADVTGTVEALWFHPRFIREKVKVGASVQLYGTLQGWNPTNRALISPKFIDSPGMYALYSEIGGLTSARVRHFFLQVRSLMRDVEDYVPSNIALEESLLPLAQALEYMHFPPSPEAIQQAKQRLAFDELFFLMAPAILARRERERERAEVLTPTGSPVATWIHSLPFTLTDDQVAAIEAILHDLGQPTPMQRLVQGDVGSGKTAVGLAAVVEAAAVGKQVAWLAPTELLARQHFMTAQNFLPNTITIGLWTRTSHELWKGGGVEQATAASVGQADLVIGTHALLTEKVHFQSLALLIIDEQHRFGVKQRAQLRLFAGKPIHLLSMTATPIPRSLALVLYGELSLSTIRQKPLGRKPVTTRVVTEENRAKAYAFLDAHMSYKQQIYVVCPTIEPAKKEEANILNQLFETVEEKKAVTTWYESLKKHFPTRRIGMLHGKMKASEKEAIMNQFREGKLDMLVATTVIEVGVDVPNATVMVIEAAERFGLAQLHQLRGRVGRSDRQSFCFLFPSASEQQENARLRVMEETNDGFVLAEKDLELRGPGELTGITQSGVPALRYASLQDVALIERIRALSPAIMHSTPYEHMSERFWRMYHPE